MVPNKNFPCLLLLLLRDSEQPGDLFLSQFLTEQACSAMTQVGLDQGDGFIKDVVGGDERAC